MSCPKGAEPHDTNWDAAFAAILADVESGGEHAPEAERVLCCVSSGYLTGGCSCRESVPADVAEGAWRRELRGGRPEGFFRFTWQRRAWLAYGLGDGSVRGVYCPAHGAERDRRAQGAGARALAV